MSEALKALREAEETLDRLLGEFRTGELAVDRDWETDLILK